MKKISVIVPCYNVENEVDRCITSIVMQTIGLEVLEIILVNDASTDGTYSKLCQWEQKYPEHIMVVNCSENMRQGGARNIGISYATGDYIGFVDSDDWIERDMYQVLYDAIVQYDCDVSVILFERDDKRGKVSDSRADGMIFGRKVTINTADERKRFFKSGWSGGVYTKLYRTSFVRENHLYFPDHLFYEDIFWGALVAYSVTSYILIDQIKYHYMTNPNSTTMRNGTHHLERLQIEILKVEELARRGYMDEFHDEIESSFLQSYWCMMMKRMCLQFPVFPYDVFESMRKTVKQLFPNYLRNPYIPSYQPDQKMFLGLLDDDFSHEEIDVVVHEYKEAFSEAALKMVHGERK